MRLNGKASRAVRAIARLGPWLADCAAIIVQARLLGITPPWRGTAAARRRPRKPPDDVDGTESKTR
jgi:hypothetical protein